MAHIEIPDGPWTVHTSWEADGPSGSRGPAVWRVEVWFGDHPVFTGTEVAEDPDDAQYAVTGEFAAKLKALLKGES